MSQCIILNSNNYWFILLCLNISYLNQSDVTQCWLFLLLSHRLFLKFNYFFFYLMSFIYWIITLIYGNNLLLNWSTNICFINFHLKDFSSRFCLKTFLLFEYSILLGKCISTYVKALECSKLSNWLLFLFKANWKIDFFKL